MAKGGVTDLKYKAFTELHVKVDTEEQKNDLYWLAEQRDWARKDM